VNVSHGRSENVGTAVAAAKFPTILTAAPMLAAAARLHLYRLHGLMSEFKFSESLHGGLDSRLLTVMPSVRQTVVSSNHSILAAIRTSGPAIAVSGERMTLDNRSVRHRHNSLTLPPALAAEEPACGGGSLVLLNHRHQRPVEGPRR
jgi:hypothetical protein